MGKKKTQSKGAKPVKQTTLPELTEKHVQFAQACDQKQITTVDELKTLLASHTPEGQKEFFIQFEKWCDAQSAPSRFNEKHVAFAVSRGLPVENVQQLEGFLDQLAPGDQAEFVTQAEEWIAAQEAAASGDAASAGDAAGKETEVGAEEPVIPQAGLVGRRCRVLRSNALYGELAIIESELSAVQVHVKLTGPAFIANDPGVTLGDGEWKLLD